MSELLFNNCKTIICVGIHGFKPESVKMTDLDSGGIMMVSEKPHKSVYTSFSKRIKAEEEALKYADELTANDVKDNSGTVIKPAGQKVQLNRSFFNVDAIAANPKCAIYISNFFGKPNVTPISAKSKTNKRALR